MLKITDIFVVFAFLTSLGLSGVNLKQIERFMFGLAVDSYKQGYINISDLERRLEQGK